MSSAVAGQVGSLDRHTVEDVGRVYVVGDDWLPSVTTVLEMKPKSEGYKNWVSRTSEEEQDQKRFYTSNRGTLAHYDCLNPFSKEELWSQDEQNSEDELLGNKEDRSGITGGPETWERFKADRNWIWNKWEFIRNIYGIHSDHDDARNSVIDVEVFSANRDIGYAGQFDLLYQDHETNETVLADLKTSKYLYDKHKLQLSSYMNAIPMTIDRLEVIRLNPEKSDWTVSSSHDWDESPEELFAQFCEYREKLSEEYEEEMLDVIGDRVDAGTAVTES